MFNLSGHGQFGIAASDNYIAGKLVDLTLSDDDLAHAPAAIEGLPAPTRTIGLGVPRQSASGGEPIRPPPRRRRLAARRLLRSVHHSVGWLPGPGECRQRRRASSTP
ncbi:MAG TPA: hypothetical protein VMV08_07015 [Gaiellaceae bacterium]|nr:hypothetical protein [Gaiellaceae bacterium]